MLKNSKHAFWEALVLTVIIFILGILLGIAYEGNKLDEINEYYSLSEISVMDSLALNKITGLGDISCNTLIDSNIEFADRIYEEAFLLERYENSGKLTNTLKLAHKKYDLLRTLLWINLIEVSKKCEGDFSTVIYLYEFETKDLTQKATHRVWSRILFDLKQEKGNEIILIPIAVDSNLISLNSLIEKFNISSFPVVIIDDEHVISEISSVGELERYLG